MSRAAVKMVLALMLVLASPRPGHAQNQDSIIVLQRLATAHAQGLDTLPIGRVIVALGRSFVGAPYVAHTLEAPGPEHVVMNLREFDCVTFVENMLALARTIRLHGDYATFRRELTRIRYRGGKLDGYASRLHYFSEWISDNAKKGVVSDVTQSLRGVRDTEPIDFMTKHRASYRQLADSGAFAQIARIEQRISAVARYVIPKQNIDAIRAQIHDGDIIAAATTIHGLDVEHTGIAVWVNGELHLMDAPLSGGFVEISALPLARRIAGIKSEDGIMVARPR